MSYFGFGLSSYRIELCDGVLTYQWFITKNKRNVFQGLMDMDGIDDVFFPYVPGFELVSIFFAGCNMGF